MASLLDDSEGDDEGDGEGGGEEGGDDEDLAAMLGEETDDEEDF